MLFSAIYLYLSGIWNFDHRMVYYKVIYGSWSKFMKIREKLVNLESTVRDLFKVVPQFGIAEVGEHNSNFTRISGRSIELNHTKSIVPWFTKKHQKTHEIRGGAPPFGKIDGFIWKLATSKFGLYPILGQTNIYFQTQPLHGIWWSNFGTTNSLPYNDNIIQSRNSTCSIIKDSSVWGSPSG